VNPDVGCALWAPSVGITEPWALALAAAENACANGASLHVGVEVTGIAVSGGRVRAVKTGGGTYPVDAVVNAAGLAADRVAVLAGVPTPRLVPRRGEYLLLVDVPRELRSAVLFPVPTPQSKGILVVPTVDGGLLLGPTADDLPPDAREATETTTQGLARAWEGARRLVPDLPRGKVVKAFAGPHRADRVPLQPGHGRGDRGGDPARGAGGGRGEAPHPGRVRPVPGRLVYRCRPRPPRPGGPAGDAPFPGEVRGGGHARPESPVDGHRRRSPGYGLGGGRLP